MDLSGNARINLPGLHVHIEGKPNAYKRTGRPPSAFAAKGSRIVRWLLLHPTEFMTQREICRATNTGEGYTSTIVRKLERDYLILRNEKGAIKPRDPALLLEAWQEEYDFSKNHIIMVTFYLATMPSSDLLKELDFQEVSGAGICEPCCVDPVQICLDLKAQPERSKEAAQRLRADHLNWDVSCR